jgi:hypothetical protein
MRTRFGLLALLVLPPLAAFADMRRSGALQTAPIRCDAVLSTFKIG